MNAINPEKIEAVEDSNLAAVSEVEAGIRDFVRNDVAYLRRPVPGAMSTDLPLEASTEGGTSLDELLIRLEAQHIRPLGPIHFKRHG